jgi:hypothetical protein
VQTWSCKRNFGTCIPATSYSHAIGPIANFSTSGQYYGIAAAMGKIGAFAGSYALDALQKAAGDDEVAAGRNPFFVASSLAFLAAGLVLLLPHVGQDTIDAEDVSFRAYLSSHGYDTSKMGLDAISESSSEERVAVDTKASTEGGQTA